VDQSLSGGSGAPLRITLTLICSFGESSDMRQIIACADFLNGNQPKRKFMCYGAVTPALWLIQATTCASFRDKAARL
jgi:hypothetical protein